MVLNVLPISTKVQLILTGNQGGGTDGFLTPRAGGELAGTFLTVHDQFAFIKIVREFPPPAAMELDFTVLAPQA